MSSSSVHTLIVGAGPAGLAGAAALAAAGREVLVLEQRQTVGPKPCAGGIPWDLFANLPKSLCERSFNHQRVVTPWQNFLITTFKPILCTIDRVKLGAQMRQQAELAGATILTGVRARQIGKECLHTDQGDFRYRYLVGADGSNSLVRRHLGLPRELVGIGISYQVPGYFEDLEWHLHPNNFGGGYAWIFPHRDGASVGAYTPRLDLKGPSLNERLKVWARQRGLDLNGNQLQPQAALINFDYRGARFGNILLAGDAAGLASGLTGEGIAAAIYSGQAAALAVLAQDHRPPDLTALLSRHALHRRLACHNARHPTGGRLLLELMALALRWRLLKPNAALVINNQGKDANKASNER